MYTNEQQVILQENITYEYINLHIKASFIIFKSFIALEWRL